MPAPAPTGPGNPASWDAFALGSHGPAAAFAAQPGIQAAIFRFAAMVFIVAEIEAVAVELDTTDAFSSVITYVNSWGSGWGDAGRFRMRLRTYEQLNGLT